MLQLRGFVHPIFSLQDINATLGLFSLGDTWYGVNLWVLEFNVSNDPPPPPPPGLNTVKRHTQSKDFVVYSKITARGSDSDDDGDRDI